MEQTALKSKKRKNIIIILSIIIFVLATAITTFCILNANYMLPRWGSCGNNVKWYYDGKGTLTISGKGRMDDYLGTVRPGDDRNNLPPLAPWRKFPITTVVVEEGVTHIGDYSMKGDEIILPNSINSIGEGAFTCYWGTTLKIPDGVTHIEDYTFEYNDSITEIILPDSIKTIGREAFLHCSSLTSIELPAGITEIGPWAFAECESLTTVSLSYGVTKIGVGAFEGCTSLKNIKIPDSVNIIGVNAFSKCTALESIDIPSSVKVIGQLAFGYCTGLNKIRFYGLPPTEAEDSEKFAMIFYDVTATAYCPKWTWSGVPVDYYGGDIEWIPWTPV